MFNLVISMRNSTLRKKAAILKSLGHPVRLSIICQLYDQKQNVSELCHCLDVAQPVVSQHLAVMRELGLIEGRRKGTHVIYRIKDEFARNLVRLVLNEKKSGPTID
jgi:DNA-binding transcriptional ArsR family regulator